MKTKVFCLPYAGGSASIYRGWSKFIDKSIELVPIELAGRGERINEPLYDSVQSAVDDIFCRIREDLQTGSYALFGHSMGAMLVYELVLKIEAEGLAKPEHLFFSGRGVPDVKPSKKKMFHLMNDEEFERELMQLGGTPIEIFENSELRQLFLPVLRSDFCLAGVDFSKRPVIPFECDISIFIGKEENLSPERIEGWKKHTKRLCTIHFFNGGHFFIRNEEKAIVNIISQKLVHGSKNRHLAINQKY